MAIKPWEELTIRDDYMFKIVMRNRRLCKRMIERVLNVSIKKLVYLEEEKSMRPGYESKGIRLDVYVEGDDRVYDVEMQVRKPEGAALAMRTRYYQSVIDGETLARGQDYGELRPSFIIFICPFDPFGEGRHIYTFRNLCVENTALELGDETVKIFLNSTGSMEDATPALKAFLDYINGKLPDDAFVLDIDDEIRRLKTVERERVSYMTFAMKMREEHNEGRMEGRMEGRREGRAEGRRDATLEYIGSLMETLNLGAEDVMNALKIPENQRPEYMEALSHA